MEMENEEEAELPRDSLEEITDDEVNTDEEEIQNNLNYIEGLLRYTENIHAVDTVSVDDSVTTSEGEESSDVPMQEEPVTVQSNSDNENYAMPSVKKRKSSSNDAIESKSSDDEEKKTNKEDDDDCSTCPICLDQWEMNGDHRLTSLKCGHLFGHSCIKRWLRENGNGPRSCPTCKRKANVKDLRNLFAKRVCALDRTEVHMLKDELKQSKRTNDNLVHDNNLLKLELTMSKRLIQKLETELDKAKNFERITKESKNPPSMRRYHFYMHKNLELCKEPGCRVLSYSNSLKTLLISQISTAQFIAPGYGIRYVDMNTLKPNNFMRISSKRIRDMCLKDESLLSVTMETTAKLFDIKEQTLIGNFTPSDKQLWSCTFHGILDNYVYLGSQNGSVYLQDKRHLTSVVQKFQVNNDFSPVINICFIPANSKRTMSGFLVCTLQTVWFFHDNYETEPQGNQLNVEGSFLSMSYNKIRDTVLITTRPNGKFPTSKHIMGTLKYQNNRMYLDHLLCLHDSTRATVMTRSTQLAVADDNFIAAFRQDHNRLTIWNGRDGQIVERFPVVDPVYDICPIMDGKHQFLAALTENRCRFYKILID